MLTPRPQRPTAYDLVRLAAPPTRDPLPMRSPVRPLPAYDPHDPVLEPRTETLHRPPVKFTPSRLGPGRGDCDTCWCPRSDHTRGFGDATGPCKRQGCDTGCTRFRPVWTWRDWARAGVLVFIGLAGTGWLTFLVAATVAARP